MSQLNAGFRRRNLPAGVKAARHAGCPGGWQCDPVKPLDAEKRAKIRGVPVAAGLIEDAAQAAQ